MTDVKSIQASLSAGKAGQEQEAKKVLPEAIRQASAGLSDIRDSLDSYKSQVSGVKGAKGAFLCGISSLGKSIFNKASKAVSKLEASAQKETQLPDLPSRPALEKPEPGALAAFEEYASSNKVEEPEVFQSLEKRTNSALIAQHKIESRNGVLLGELIQHKEEEVEALRKAFIENQEKAHKKQKKSKLFGWLGLGGGVAATLFTVAGVVAGVFTGGATIPVFLGIGAGVAGMASGSSEIAKGVFRWQGEKYAGSAFEARESRTAGNQTMEDYMSDLQAHDSSLGQIANLMRQVIENRPKAF